MLHFAFGEKLVFGGSPFSAPHNGFARGYKLKYPIKLFIIYNIIYPNNVEFLEFVIGYFLDSWVLILMCCGFAGGPFKPAFNWYGGYYEAGFF